MLERGKSGVQTKVIKELKRRFPGCLVLKNDSSYLQGVLDLLVLWNDRWAMLEVKAAETSDHQPNQDYYVRVLDEMSFAAFIYPENMEEVLRDLQHAFSSRRNTRIPQPQ